MKFHLVFSAQLWQAIENQTKDPSERALLRQSVHEYLDLFGRTSIPGKGDVVSFFAAHWPSRWFDLLLTELDHGYEWALSLAEPRLTLVSARPSEIYLDFLEEELEGSGPAPALAKLFF